MKVVVDTSVIVNLFSGFYPDRSEVANDKKMANMARSAGLRAFHLVEEADEFFNF